MKVKVLKENDFIMNGRIYNSGDELDLPEDLCNRLIKSGVFQKVGKTTIPKAKKTESKPSLFGSKKEEDVDA